MSAKAARSGLERVARDVWPGEFRDALLDHGVILLRDAVDTEIMTPLTQAATAMIDHYDAIPREVMERQIAEGPPAARGEGEERMVHGLHYDADFANFSHGRWSLFDPIRKSGLADLASAAWPEHTLSEYAISPLHRIEPFRRGTGYMGPPLQMHVDAAFHQHEWLGLNFWTPLTPAGGDYPGLQVLPLGVEASKAHMEYRPEGHAGEPDMAQMSKFRNDNASLEALERAGLLDDLWQPILQPGDVLVFTNFTIHGTWSVEGMTRPRTSIEARVLLYPR